MEIEIYEDFEKCHAFYIIVALLNHRLSGWWYTYPLNIMGSPIGMMTFPTASGKIKVMFQSPPDISNIMKNRMKPRHFPIFLWVFRRKRYILAPLTITKSQLPKSAHQRSQHPTQCLQGMTIDAATIL